MSILIYSGATSLKHDLSPVKVVLRKATKQRGKALPVEDFIIYVYCCVEDVYRELVKTPLRCRGFQPKLTDSEVITMEIMGEFMGKDQDKSMWQYFQSHWKHYKT